MLFHVFLVEEKLEKKGKNENEKLEKTISWKDWLKEGQFYAVSRFLLLQLKKSLFNQVHPIGIKKYSLCLKIIVYVHVKCYNNGPRFKKNSVEVNNVNIKLNFFRSKLIPKCHTNALNVKTPSKR